MSGRAIHGTGTVLLSLAMAAIGVALFVQALGAHASVFSARLLLGVLFMAGGGMRLYVEARRRRNAPER